MTMRRDLPAFKTIGDTANDVAVAVSHGTASLGAIRSMRAAPAQDFPSPNRRPFIGASSRSRSTRCRGRRSQLRGVDASRAVEARRLSRRARGQGRGCRAPREAVRTGTGCQRSPLPEEDIPDRSWAASVRPPSSDVGGRADDETIVTSSPPRQFAAPAARSLDRDTDDCMSRFVSPSPHVASAHCTHRGAPTNRNRRHDLVVRGVDAPARGVSPRRPAPIPRREQRRSRGSHRGETSSPQDRPVAAARRDPRAARLSL